MASKKSFASKASILAGGSKPYREATVEVVKGDPLSIRYRPLSAAEGMEIRKQAELLKKSEDKSDADSEGFKSSIRIVADHLVDEDGGLLTTFEELMDCPMDMLLALFAAIIPGAKEAMDKATAEADQGNG